jgi:acetylglutamate kinase
VNRAVCAAIGPGAVPLFGDEIGLEAVRIPELGYVGAPVPSRPRAVELVLGAGFVPVVAPLAAGPLNVNADEAAAALAVGLGADRLLFVSDVPGLLLGGGVAAAIAADEAERLLDAGELGGGIVPKLRAAVLASRQGVDAAIGATAVVA